MSGIKGKSGGHNRKSDREKELLGVRKDRIKSLSMPQRVECFAEFPYALEESKRIDEYFRPILINSGKMDGASALTFHQFCDVAGRWFIKRRELAAKGDHLPVKNKDGAIVGVITAPWFNEERDLQERCLRLLREMTLTPSLWRVVEGVANGKPVSRFKGILKK